MTSSFLSFFHSSIWYGLLAVLLGLLIYQLWLYLAIIFVSILLAIVLWPFVVRVKMFVNSIKLAALIVYLLFLILLGGCIGLLIHMIAPDIEQLNQQIPALIQDFINRLGINETNVNPSSFVSVLPGFGNGLFSFVGKSFDVVLYLFFTIALSYFWIVEHDKVLSFVTSSVSDKKLRSAVVDFLRKSEVSLRTWFRGQIVLSVFVGIISGIAYWIIGLDFIWALAFLAGLFEIVPTVGPLLALIPAIFVASTQSLLMIGWLLVAYSIIQLIEGYILLPKIMQNRLSFSPIVVLISILVAQHFMGFLGAVLALPLLIVGLYLLDLVNIWYKMKVKNSGK